MEHPVDTRFMYLPGIDSLKSAEYFESKDAIGRRAVSRFMGDESHWKYLDNPTFDSYLQMPKTLVNSEGAEKLIEIGDELVNETMPRFLDAAGWAFAEAGLALSDDSAERRIELVKKAEAVWRRALVNDLNLGRKYNEEWTANENMSHRLAMNLAYSPLIKSIIVGNVTDVIRTSVMRDTTALATDSARVMDELYTHGNVKASEMHFGFLFEANALMTLLNMDDARYIALPSTARADSGYYHSAQTHDISIINQHWGEIRKVIPVEIKSHSTRKQRERYQALLIRGKMHLSVKDHDPRSTVKVFQSIIDGTASEKDITSIESMSAKLRDMLRLYQKGITSEGIATNSLTRFYNADKAAEVYPELSRFPRKK